MALTDPPTALYRGKGSEHRAAAPRGVGLVRATASSSGKPPWAVDLCLCAMGEKENEMAKGICSSRPPPCHPARAFPVLSSAFLLASCLLSALLPAQPKAERYTARAVPAGLNHSRVTRYPQP